MNQNEALKRLEVLEAETRRDDLGPFLERLAATTGITAGEIVAEAERVMLATEGQSRAGVLAWIALDCGMTVDALAAEADVLLAASAP
jgi:hypothetical protein